MGTTFRFIASLGEANQIVEWFSSLPEKPKVIPTNNGFWIHFSNLGKLIENSSGGIIASESPLVSIFPPQTRLGCLWTVGEVHFLATPLRERFPHLHKVSSSFCRWLESSQLVFSRKQKIEEDFSYFLEGSIQNFGSEIYALPDGLKELKRGRYFVSEQDNAALLDNIKRKLLLRGVEFN